jgi:putative tryptophan/tyrosine transport system substrate-binding protein
VILATPGTPPVLAVKAATATIPIVFPNVGDPVGQGLVASLARPGGNLTGISILFPDLTAKRIELLAELVQDDKVIGLIVNPANPTNEATIGDAPTAARAKGRTLSIQNAGNDDEIDAAFTQFTQQRIGALLVGADPFFSQRPTKFVALASRHAIPAVYAWREFVAKGGLLSYGPSNAGQYRQAARLVAKILDGAKPADLPVEQPTKFELVVNLNTAKTLGLTVPPSILARADEVIE